MDDRNEALTTVLGEPTSRNENWGAPESGPGLLDFSLSAEMAVGSRARGARRTWTSMMKVELSLFPSSRQGLE